MDGTSRRPSPAIAHGAKIALPAGFPHTLVGWISQRVSQNPNGVIRTYVRPGEHRSQTYMKLWETSGQIAAALHSAGVSNGGPVVILIDDIIEFLPAFWACLRAGVMAVPLMSAARAAINNDNSALEQAFSRLDHPCILADRNFEPLALRACSDRGATLVKLSSVDTATAWTSEQPPCIPAYLVPTSGSTGQLKLAALTDSILLHRIFTMHHLQIPTNFLGLFPLDGVTGLSSFYLIHQSWTQIPAAALVAKAGVVLDAIEEFEISALGLTSSMVKAILAGEANSDHRVRRLRSLKKISIGAEPVSHRIAKDFADLLAKHDVSSDILFAGYGTTETGTLTIGAQVSFGSPELSVPLGPPTLNVDIRVAGDDDCVLFNGEIGEVQVSSPFKIFSGYWGEPELSRAFFTSDGWWKTGDRGCLNDDQLTLHGRLKEVFIAHGRKFSLLDIDTELNGQLEASDHAYSCALLLPGGDAEQLGVGFVTANTDRHYQQQVASRLRSAVVRRFGVRAEFVVALDRAAIPLTATGKVRRTQLSQVLISQRSSRDQSSLAPAIPSTEAVLETLWREALGLPEGAIARDDNFFELGGDSLRSLILHAQILEIFGYDISAEEFFAEPTFTNLLRVVEHYARLRHNRTTSKDAASWPLDPQLRGRLLAAFETWPGERPTSERMVVGLNTTGTRAPIFWVFNDNVEPARLAGVLGPDQPLYGFRSGVAISTYSEDEIQAFALRYVAEMAAVRPDGPVFIGGNCQGGIIALALAQHALRRGRHVPLLILMNWSFQLHGYSGRVLFVSGRDDISHNPSKLFSRPDLAWRRAFPEFEFAEIPGAHGHAFDDSNVQALSAVLVKGMQAALLAPPNLMPRFGYAGSIMVDTPPTVMSPGEICEIEVTVRNTSPVAWDSGGRSGLMLGNRWTDAAGAVLVHVDGRSPLPGLTPGQAAHVRLAVTAPAAAGKQLHLLIDIVEEGNGWFAARGTRPFEGVVTIASSRQRPRRF